MKDTPSSQAMVVARGAIRIFVLLKGAYNIARYYGVLYAPKLKMYALIKTVSADTKDEKPVRVSVLDFTERKNYTIGKSALIAELRFSNISSVSRNHAELRFDAKTEKFTIADCPSTFGTFIVRNAPYEMMPKSRERFILGDWRITIQKEEDF